MCASSRHLLIDGDALPRHLRDGGVEDEAKQALQEARRGHEQYPRKILEELAKLGVLRDVNGCHPRIEELRHAEGGDDGDKRPVVYAEAHHAVGATRLFHRSRDDARVCGQHRTHEALRRDAHPLDDGREEEDEREVYCPLEARVGAERRGCENGDVPERQVEEESCCGEGGENAEGREGEAAEEGEGVAGGGGAGGTRDNEADDGEVQPRLQQARPRVKNVPRLIIRFCMSLVEA